ncbi:MAG TPA: hypothetical protein VKA22_04870, partial [Desulfuromonadales bacterium]|nr:hypothetical protein [Desulfuromonadales bacterium]
MMVLESHIPGVHQTAFFAAFVAVLRVHVGEAAAHQRLVRLLTMSTSLCRPSALSVSIVLSLCSFASP